MNSNGSVCHTETGLPWFFAGCHLEDKTAFNAALSRLSFSELLAIYDSVTLAKVSILYCMYTIPSIPLSSSIQLIQDASFTS